MDKGGKRPNRERVTRREAMMMMMVVVISTASGALGVGGVRDICSSIDGVTSRR